MVRAMTIDDYDMVYDLWSRIDGMGLRSIDDSKEGVNKFLKRNPGCSVVAVEDEKVVGAILSGHDGRRGCFYHVCVDPHYRMRGIAKSMVTLALDVMKSEGINKVSLIAFKNNRLGNGFWGELGWTKRDDLNYYDMTTNEENITNFVKL